MRIAQKVWMSIGAAMALSTLFASLIAVILAGIRNDLALNDRYLDIINKTSALNSLSSNFQERPTSRVVRQLENVRSSLAGGLEAISSTDARESFLIRQIRQNHAELGALLDQQIRQDAPSAEAGPDNQEGSQLSTRIRLKARSITDDATRLAAINQERIQAAQERTSVLVLILVGAVILSNVVVAFAASGALVRGVLRLNEGVRRIAGGDLEHRVPARGNDELTELTNNFNDMTASLQASLDRMRDHARQLEQSNRELQDFAHVASHDLQEPLRKIRAFADRLRLESEAGLNDAGLDYLSRMERAAERMQELIDALLTYSRLSARQQPFRMTSLNAAVEAALEDLEERTRETGASVDVGDLPAIQADPVQMRQLFLNLLSNALKYHRPGVPPVVQVRGRLLPQDNGREICEVVVTDNGIGFDERFLGKIFTPFQRLHGKKRFEGTGIGLAICRRIAERHGGTITAVSQPGRGSSFIMRLPIASETT